MSGAHEAPQAVGAIGRIIGLLAGLVLLAANLGTVDVDVLVVSIPVPLSLLALAAGGGGAFAALRWNAARIAAERDRRERRREMDRLLGRRSSAAVRH
ncbi:hypothetical protein [Ilumatobacter coccineus]|uniref:Lipopolysaccharide assembly protein A domain-containing protein n=1 Tax=Ilumatobacter coccineus (strain NBRC 103263 / KCTC 29153 / YM16-304) TaxID=1313172 RepID=A0A6C7EBL9_ILUCY|nr:hypothetical protein [Ilumatobacter coccineus]BAN03780.1 hypothetical protein YM304_34660 [Ilumatobacter coccineus YM16-304]